MCRICIAVSTLVSAHLENYGIHPKATEQQMLQRIAGSTSLEPVQILASAVEQPKGYDREGLQHYNAFSQLNRMIDSVPAESHGRVPIQTVSRCGDREERNTGTGSRSPRDAQKMAAE